MKHVKFLVSSDNVGTLQPIIAEFARQWMFVDFAGPFHSLLHVLLIVCKETGNTVLVPTCGTATEDLMQGILHHLVSIFGLFQILSAERGTTFISEIMKRICSLLNIKHND